MSGKPTIHQYKNIERLAKRLRDILTDASHGSPDFILLYAYNGTGKTRLSMAFKDAGKKEITRPMTVNDGVDQALTINEVQGDTLYFNAYTEDLFHWDNDLENDSERRLKINSGSKFFSGFRELAIEEKIRPYLHRYADYEFIIDYDNWTISFSRADAESIKVSRGEENIFIWCIFLAICELTIDDDAAYAWVKFIYIDDPISSLDDNNAIAVASDLAQLLQRGRGKLKTVISSHHGLFFNVMFNELKKSKPKSYFLHRNDDAGGYELQATDDTPFFHHVAMLSELQQAAESGKLYTHHFNSLRSILEKTATFFGHSDFSICLDDKDEALHARALNLLSHGGYSIYEPREMMQDNKSLFKEILANFLGRYQFQLRDILAAQTTQTNDT